MQLLIARQPAEAARLGDAELVAGRLGDFGEVVGHGVEFVAAVLHERRHQPVAAAAAADQPQLDLPPRRGRLGSVGGQGVHASDTTAKSAMAAAPPRSPRREIVASFMILILVWLKL